MNDERHRGLAIYFPEPACPPTSRPPPTLNRRDVVKDAAWAVPALMIGAPAAEAAASGPCTTATATWAPKTTSGTSTTATGGITANTVANGKTYIRTSTNFTTHTISNGSPMSGQAWFELDQAKDNSKGQTVTIAFPQQVYCVTFYVNDIDTEYTDSEHQYRDQVTVSGFTATSSSAYVSASDNMAVASHTADGPTATAYEWDYSSSANGLAKFTAAGPLTTITLTWLNANYPGRGLTSTRTCSRYTSRHPVLDGRLRLLTSPSSRPRTLAAAFGAER